MRPILFTTGLLCVVVVSVAFAGSEPESTTNADLAARVEALSKELEALKPLPKQVAELKDEIRGLELQIGLQRAQPVSAPAPSGIPANAVPGEINGTTFYFIPVGSQPQSKARPAGGARLP